MDRAPDRLRRARTQVQCQGQPKARCQITPNLSGAKIVHKPPISPKYQEGQRRKENDGGNKLASINKVHINKIFLYEIIQNRIKKRCVMHQPEAKHNKKERSAYQRAKLPHTQQIGLLGRRRRGLGHAKIGCSHKTIRKI